MDRFEPAAEWKPKNKFSLKKRIGIAVIAAATAAAGAGVALKLSGKSLSTIFAEHMPCTNDPFTHAIHEQLPLNAQAYHQMICSFQTAQISSYKPKSLQI